MRLSRGEELTSPGRPAVFQAPRIETDTWSSVAALTTESPSLFFSLLGPSSFSSTWIVTFLRPLLWWPFFSSSSSSSSSPLSEFVVSPAVALFGWFYWLVPGGWTTQKWRDAARLLRLEGCQWLAKEWGSLQLQRSDVLQAKKKITRKKDEKWRKKTLWRGPIHFFRSSAIFVVGLKQSKSLRMGQKKKEGGRRDPRCVDIPFTEVPTVARILSVQIRWVAFKFARFSYLTGSETDSFVWKRGVGAEREREKKRRRTVKTTLSVEFSGHRARNIKRARVATRSGRFRCLACVFDSSVLFLLLKGRADGGRFSSTSLREEKKYFGSFFGLIPGDLLLALPA